MPNDINQVNTAAKELLQEIRRADEDTAIQLLVVFGYNMYKSGYQRGTENAIKSIEMHILSQTGEGNYGPN